MKSKSEILLEFNRAIELDIEETLIWKGAKSGQSLFGKENQLLSLRSMKTMLEIRQNYLEANLH
ncbi:MAG: hypothetical protein AB9834_19255 [Lentimicrobium sp.]